MNYINTYIKSLEFTGDYSKNTVQAYTSDLKRFFQFLEQRFGREPVIGDFNSKIIKEFLENEKEKGLSASTLHRRKVVMNQFAHFLFKTGNFSKDDILDIRNWKQKLWKEIYKREVHSLSDLDLDKLFGTLNQEDTSKSIRDCCLISLMLETGLSIGKIISLNLSDLDMAKERVSVLINGESLNFSIHKTAGTLRKYLLFSRKEYTQSTTEDALFLSQMGGRISRQGVWQLVRDWGKNAKINIPVSPRLLKNTRVRLLVESGLTTLEIQKRIGHGNRYSTRALVRKIYRSIL